MSLEMSPRLSSDDRGCGAEGGAVGNKQSSSALGTLVQINLAVPSSLRHGWIL